MYNELNEYLQKKAEQFQSDWNDVPEWVVEEAAKYMEKQLRLRAAGTLLSADSDEELEEMIKLIEESDPYEELWNIEGVSIWEQVNESMTAEQFLRSI